MANPKSKASPKATSVVATLETIVAAGANGMYTSPEVHSALVEAGLVEINPAIKNQAGEIATRATQKGIDSIMTNNTTAAPAATETNVKSGFIIEDAIPVPKIAARGRAASSAYPFDDMQVGQSFFVPNSEKRPNAAKSLASTVSGANARYAVPSADGAHEMVSVKQYALDANGKRVKDTNGKFVVTGPDLQESRPVMVQTREFIVRSVVENGVAGARIWRQS